jgi:hypothetical protein
MKKYHIISALLILFSITACQDDLEETNINPNESQTAQPDYLLSNAIRTSVDSYWGTDNNLNSTLLFVQHVAKIQYTEQDRYIYANDGFNEAWTTLYAKSLTDISKVIELGEKENNPNYQAVGLIVRSWVFSLLTDAYGDIPYSQAVKISEHLTPQYDSQQDVYTGLLNDLKTANSLIDPAQKPISGDLLYNGNLEKWKKFANSLRYRFALRIADRDPQLAQQVIAELQNELLISDNSEIAQLKYLASPNQNPIARFFETRDDYRVSRSIVETLKSLNDPRLPVFANKTETTTPEGYIGVPNGLTTSDASKLGFSRTSKIGAYFTKSDSPGVILSYAEVLFNRAEAAARGFTSENAADLYNQAITASLRQFGVADADITTYLAQPAVQYEATNFRKSIGNQKWIALFGQGMEAFAEWRRLDYPQLPPAEAGVLNGKFPIRFIYPGSEQSLNRNSYQSAVAHQGEDVLTTKLWFDVY